MVLASAAHILKKWSFMIEAKILIILGKCVMISKPL